MKFKTLILLFILLILTARSPLLAQEFYGMNCGNYMLSYTNPQGEVFFPDQTYPNSLGFGYYDPWNQSEDLFSNRITPGDEGLDSLYYYRREGKFSYLFEVTNSDYAVNIYLKEETYHGKNFRAFSVLIEGDTVVHNLDIFEVTGKGYCMPLRFLTECNDNLLNIDFISDTSAATLSGISVRRIWEDTNSPPVIDSLSTIGGYMMNIVYWDYCVAEDLAGYRVYRRQVGETWQLKTPDIHPFYRYLDYDVDIGVPYEYTVTSEDLWGNESDFSDSLTATAIPPENSPLIRYEMDISDENLYLMNVDVGAKIWVDAFATLEGNAYPCSVRYRGGSTVGSTKKNYKIKLLPGTNHRNRDAFNLQAEGIDPSILKNRLGYTTFDLSDIPTPMTQNIYLEKNGEYIGVYLDIEQVDNHFLERNGWSTAGNLYKCIDDLEPRTLFEYQQYYIKQNNEWTNWDDIIEFIEWLDTVDSLEFRQEVGNRCDTDGYIDYIVGLIANSDGDFGYNNYFMYNNPVDDRWYFTSWDHNLVFDDPYKGIDYGTRENPLVYTFTYYNRLHNCLLHDDLYRYAYCKKLERFLLDGFSVASNYARIDSLYENIYENAIRDIYKAGRERPDLFLTSREPLYWFSGERVDYLLSEIPEYITDPDRAPYFRINEIQNLNQNTIADEAGDYDPWIEIYNLSAVELDMSDFVLHLGQESWLLPEEAIVDEWGFLLIWLDGEPGEGLFHSSIVLTPDQGTIWLEGNHSQTADSISFPALQPDHVWARNIDGAGIWLDNIFPTPNTTNTPIPDPSNLVINELLAINSSINFDEAGDYDDWVEIYNTSSTETIPLLGLYLTDDFTNPFKWVFPDTMIPPLGHLLVWCDKEPLEGPLHATFKLSGGGEVIGLYDRNRGESIDTLTFGTQLEDLSWGRYPDGFDDWGFREPTPGNVNVGISDEAITSSLPRLFSLHPNFPNPFNPTTTVKFGLPKAADVNLKVYNIQGREVAVLKNKAMKAGIHSVVFNATGFASGIYFFRIEADDFTATKKMLLLK